VSTFRGRLSVSDRARYRICVQGTIDQAWSEAFTNMAMSLESPMCAWPTTVLEGDVLDQAELIGLLDHLYGVGCSLLLVQALEPQATAGEETPHRSSSIGSPGRA
jgi:hypothetical protein